MLQALADESATANPDAVAQAEGAGDEPAGETHEFQGKSKELIEKYGRGVEVYARG